MQELIDFCKMSEIVLDKSLLIGEKSGRADTLNIRHCSRWVPCVRRHMETRIDQNIAIARMASAVFKYRAKAFLLLVFKMADVATMRACMYAEVVGNAMKLYLRLVVHLH